MKHGKNNLVSNRAKANVFSSHYSSVSRLHFTKEERSVNREAKQMLREDSGGNHDSCCPITMPELTKAIARMKTKGAPGPDDIPPSFIKALGPTGFSLLCS